MKTPANHAMQPTAGRPDQAPGHANSTGIFVAPFLRDCAREIALLGSRWKRLMPISRENHRFPEKFENEFARRWHTAATVISANANRRGFLFRASAFQQRGATRAPSS
jgi:hypothetical protein